MGAGYYLGEYRHSGWIIKKVPVYNRERTIEDFAYTAGSEDNIHISKSNTTPPTNQTGESKCGCTMVEYSAKAVAVFGETKAIKDELRAMGGRFNSRLTFNGKKLKDGFPEITRAKVSLLFRIGLNNVEHRAEPICPTKTITMRVDIDMKFIHRYNKNLSCIILAETAKGWKVSQTETFANPRKKPKVTVQFYHAIWFDDQKGEWDAVNN